MNKTLCFISHEMADFEVVLTLHLLMAIDGMEIIPIGYDLSPVIAQSGLTYLPRLTLDQALTLPGVEALILPGGPIQPQRKALTELICKIHAEQKLLAAICFGPQYLGRAGILDHHRFTTSCSVDTIRSLQVDDPFPWQNYDERRLVQDDNVITARGGAFVDFAFAVNDSLGTFTGRAEQRERLYCEIMDR